MQAITIFEIRENSCWVEQNDGIDVLIINSDPRGYYQNMASAQLQIQELINLRVAARLECAERHPLVYSNSPQAISNVAANRLHFNLERYRVRNISPEELADMPIFFIKEITVKP